MKQLLFLSTLLLCSILPSAAQDNYYHQQAERYQRQAEYYQRQAENYRREAAYYLKKAESYQREAKYYTQRGDLDRAQTCTRYTENELTNTKPTFATPPKLMTKPPHTSATQPMH